jgi:hypothetical protein
LWCDAETSGLDVVVEEFEEDLHDMGVCGLATENIFFFVHGLCVFFFIVFEIFR